MRYFCGSIKKLTSVLIRPGSMVRIHHGPLSISSNSQIVYHDLIARGRQVETAKRWRALVQRVASFCCLCSLHLLVSALYSPSSTLFGILVISERSS